MWGWGWWDKQKNRGHNNNYSPTKNMTESGMICASGEITEGEYVRQ